MPENSRYIGSTRFYKNLLLLTITLLVVVLLVLTLVYHQRYKAAETILEQKYGAALSELTLPQSEPLAYQEHYPDFYAPQPFAATVRTANVAYLTFDSEPSAATDQLLALLAQHNIKATFFVSGNTANDPEYDARLRAIVAEGHTLGMGSWSGDYATIYASVESYLADQYALYTYLYEVTGVAPSVLRFPGGSINSYNAGLYRELIAEMVRRGFVPYDWNLSADGGAGSTQLGAQELVLRVQDGLAGLDRTVLLLHDDAERTTTLEALPQIIALLQENGFSFAPLTPEVKPVLFAYTG